MRKIFKYQPRIGRLVVTRRKKLTAIKLDKDISIEIDYPSETEAKLEARIGRLADARIKKLTAIKKRTAIQLDKETLKVDPSESEELLQARLEADQLDREFEAFQRRRKQLSRKLNNGTITKQEEREMDRMDGKGVNAMLQKLMVNALKLSDVVQAHHENSKGRPDTKAQKRKKPVRKLV